MATIEKRISSDGKTSYRVKVRLKGCPPQTATFERRTDAKKWAEDIQSAIREGRHFKTVEAKRHTVGELIDRYAEFELPRKGSQRVHQGQQLAWWKKQIGERLLADATPALIAECREKLARKGSHQGEGLSPATVNRYLAALSHAFTVAVNEWGWLDDSPLRKVKKLKEPGGRVRFLSDDERGRLLDACRESSNAALYPVVVLALSTGMREGEILGLYWKAPKEPPKDCAWGVVDASAGRIVLHQTKNKERRVLPLSGHALDLVRDLAKVRSLSTNLVFPGRKPEQPIDLRFAWVNALEKAGIQNFRFHDLRHSAASYLAMDGASLNEIAEVLGHKTLQMVKRYAHLSEAHTGQVIASMNEKIFGEAGRK